MSSGYATIDLTFKEMNEAFSPKMTPEIMKGYICHEIVDMEKRMDTLFRKAYDGLFNGALRYHSFRRCTSQETFDFTTRPKNTRRTFELAQSDIYLIHIQLSYLVADREQPLNDIYMWLPFPRPGGLIYMGGPLFQLIPVVSDKVISPEEKHLFVRLEQYKMKFYCDESYAIVANDDRLFGKVCWSNIYKQKIANKKLQSSRANSTLVHYLLARIGFSRMFQTYAGFVPVVGTEKEINQLNFDPSAWIIVKTAYDLIKPQTFIGSLYTPTKIRLAIPKEKWNDATKSLVFGFYYVVDNFSNQCSAAGVDQVDMWKLTLGYILFSSSYTAGRILSLVDEHFLSSDTYMDDISIQKLKEKGYYVNNFSDLLGLIITRYEELYREGGTGQKVYGKYLDTLREVLYPITLAIFTTKYALMKQAVKGIPQFGVIKDIFTRKFKPGPIFKLTSKGIVAEAVSYSGDHMYLKLTSRLSLQESTPGTRTSKGNKSLNENDYLNTSMMMTGSILFLSKKKPIPLSHANPFMKIDLETGTILEDLKFKTVLDEADVMLSKKS